MSRQRTKTRAAANGHAAEAKVVTPAASSCTPAARTKLSVPEVARQWGISADKLLAWIRSGELRATNVATSAAGRPRWRIDTADLLAFEQRRAGGPVPQAERRRRRPADVIEYF